MNFMLIGYVNQTVIKDNGVCFSSFSAEMMFVDWNLPRTWSLLTALIVHVCAHVYALAYCLYKSLQVLALNG